MGAPKTLRVVVADDSQTIRRLLRGVLDRAHGFQIVGEASDGARCVELVSGLKPDIVVLDVDMPGTDGLEATGEIMHRAPTPILIFTSSAVMRRREVPFRALAAGALDVFAKPRVSSEAEYRAAADALRHRLRILAPVHVIRRRAVPAGAPGAAPGGRSAASPRTSAPGAERSGAAPGRTPTVVAVGASTGGPQALAEVLKGLTPGGPAGILVVQHMAPEFLPGFADWLGSVLSLPVRIPSGGERLENGVVWVAPGDRHLRLGREGLLELTREEPVNSCRPSVDVLFESVAEARGPEAVGVLLTGMGEDGARGLLRLRERGGLTVAQDEASSVVFGMPGTAVRLGAARLVLGLAQIGPYLSRCLERRLAR